MESDACSNFCAIKEEAIAVRAVTGRQNAAVENKKAYIFIAYLIII